MRKSDINEAPLLKLFWDTESARGGFKSKLIQTFAKKKSFVHLHVEEEVAMLKNECKNRATPGVC